MPFNVGYTTPDGIVIPDATSTDDVPHHWQGQYDGSNGGTTNLNKTRTQGPFASVAALTAAFASIPDSQKPFLAGVTGLGLYQWIPTPYSIWVPALGKSSVQTAGTWPATSLGLGSAPTRTTDTLVITAQQYPQIALITYRAYVAQTGGATLARTYVNVNGTSDGYQAVSSFPGSTSVTLPVTIPGTATGGASTFSVTGGLENGGGAAGSAVQVDGTDTPRTRLTVVVSPLFANVGGTPF